MANDVSGEAAQISVVEQIRTILMRYAFVFTAIGAVFTFLNFGHLIYIRTVDRAQALTQDPTLVAQQTFLRKFSNGGTHYRNSFQNNDDQISFDIAIRVLFNYYENTAVMIDNLMIIGPIARAKLQCPLVKHVRIFILDEDREGDWISEAKFLRQDEFPATMMMYYAANVGADEACRDYWRPRLANATQKADPS